jgi:hypothetical protein
MTAISRLVIPLTLLAALTAGAAGLAAQNQAVLPPKLAGWARGDWTQVDARQLETLAGNEAAILREYGCLRAESASYRKGASRWQVTLFRMQDRTGAFGAHSLLRGAGPALPVGEAGTRTAARQAFYQGNYFVWADPLADTAALGALAQALARLPEHVASLPVLDSFLPAAGRVRGSEQYFLGPAALAQVYSPAPGDWVGFAYGAEVQLARYQYGGGEAVLLLISYPTPQIAAERLRAFEQFFHLTDEESSARARKFVRRLGTLLVFVSGPRTTDEAAPLLEGIRRTTEVSWSDPSDPRAAFNWTHTLLNIFVGTGLILLFTLLSGLAYGLLRLGVKRFFPGLIFDRPSDSDIIIFKLEGPPPKQH